MKKVLFLAMLLTIFPMNYVWETGYTIQEIDISYFISEIIGILLYSIYFQKYTKKQKKLFVAIVFLCCISYCLIAIPGILDMNINEWKTNTMSDMGPYVINTAIYLGAYLCKIILSVYLGLSVLRNKTE